MEKYRYNRTYIGCSNRFNIFLKKKLVTNKLRSCPGPIAFELACKEAFQRQKLLKNWLIGCDHDRSSNFDWCMRPDLCHTRLFRGANGNLYYNNIVFGYKSDLGLFGIRVGFSRQCFLLHFLQLSQLW